MIRLGGPGIGRIAVKQPDPGLPSRPIRGIEDRDKGRLSGS
jgi:hypothetical protein